MKIALCGVIAALSVVIMFFTGVIPTATIALPALAGCMLIPVVAELGLAWGGGVYAVCSLLSFLLAPDREAVLFYVLFFGYYPVLVGLFGRIKSRAVQMAAKLVVFNAAVIVETLISIYVLGIPWENISFLGAATPVVLLALANIVFVLYDRALGGIIAMYFVKLHDTVRKMLKMN